MVGYWQFFNRVNEEKIMKKPGKLPVVDSVPPKNPVAKFAHLFNKAVVFSDKRKYSRKAKHSVTEPFSIAIA